MPHARNLLGCFLFRGDDVFKKIGVLSGGERSRVALVCMLLRPANFLILDEPTNHLDMQSQDVLKRALIDYPGSVLIVSHNRDFLDPVVTKTLEFRPGQPPKTYVGNITYYIEKSAADKALEVSAAKAANTLSKTIAAPKIEAASTKGTSTPPGVNRKDQRRQEAEARELRSKVLKPLETEFEALEAKIAQLESSQTEWTAKLSDPAIVGQPEQFRYATNEVAKIASALEISFTRWGALSEEIERIKARLGE
jgi:ATP-binding cassette, subfamily F, member 3